MTEVEAGFLAARLLCVIALVLLAPGFAFLSAVRVPAEWPERVVLAFSLSYSWIFILSIVVPLRGWTVDHAALATALLVGGLIVATVKRRWRHDASLSVGRPGATTVVVIAVVIAAGVAGWVIEPPFTGEEALDFASLSRFADGGPITLDNTSLLPDTRPIYLFQPYQLASGMIARWSDVDPLIAFVKFRTFLAPLCLLCIYALLRRLTLTHVEAVVAFIVVVLFIALEIETWERNSLFPYVRRQGFTAAVLVPALLVLYITATRAVTEDGGRRLRRIALGVIPVMFAASMSTHAMQMVTFLSFAVMATVAILTGLDRGGDRKLAVATVLALAVTAGVYLTVHSRAVPSVAERGDSRRLVRSEQLERLVTDQGVRAWVSVDGDNIFIGSSPLTTAAVIGVPSLGLVALRAPAAAAVLALGTVPLALLHANPAGFIVLRWLVAPATMREAGGYFMLMGILGAALGLVGLAQGILHVAASRPHGLRPLVVGSFLLVAVLIAGPEVVRWLGDVASTDPSRFLLVQTAIAAVALAIAAKRPRPIPTTTSFPVGLAILTTCLAIPLGVPGLVFGGAFAREANASVVTRFQAAGWGPTVLEWPAYYEELASTIRPPLPVPRAVVDELRRRIPSRQVLLAHPSYSCALVVLIDAYCINPASIYGDYFHSAARYHADYVTPSDGQVPEHPFFNAGLSLTEAEDRLIREYRVSYVLADPEHAEQIALKLKSATVGVTLEIELDGYRLYKLSGS